MSLHASKNWTAIRDSNVRTGSQRNAGALLLTSISGIADFENAPEARRADSLACTALAPQLVVEAAALFEPRFAHQPKPMGDSAPRAPRTC